MNRIPIYCLSALLMGAVFFSRILAVPVELPKTFITLKIGNFDYKFLHYENLSIDTPHPKAVRAIVVVHGSGRQAKWNYDNMNIAASAIGKNDGTVIWAAPQFLIADDISEFGLSPDSVIHWTYNGDWKQGDRSASTQNANISSFAIVDSFVYKLAAKNPNLRSIVVAGHSAGGQFVNRYAAGSRIEQTIKQRFNIDMHYLVTNPSSYVYLDTKRRIKGTLDKFVVPNVSLCPEYNQYKFGLDNLNPYMQAAGAAQIRLQYKNRKVYYLLGELDNDSTHSSLDKRCQAMLQGVHRLQRGRIYYNYMKSYYGPGITQKHFFYVIPGVAHSSRGIFTSTCGKYVLFGVGSCSPISPTIDSPSPNAIPKQPITARNFPNPFNPSTTIRFNISAPEKLSVRIYDVNGQLMTSLAEQRLWDAGTHTLVWNGRDHQGNPVSSGIYFYQIGGKKRHLVKQMTLIK